MELPIATRGQWERWRQKRCHAHVWSGKKDTVTSEETGGKGPSFHGSKGMGSAMAASIYYPAFLKLDARLLLCSGRSYKAGDV